MPLPKARKKINNPEKEKNNLKLSDENNMEELKYYSFPYSHYSSPLSQFIISLH